MKYPVLVRPLLEGVRCRIVNGTPTPAPNNQMMLEILSGLPSFDGIIICNASGEDNTIILDPEITQEVFDHSTAKVRFFYFVFDLITIAPTHFDQRLVLARNFANACGKHVQYVNHILVNTEAELHDYLDHLIGYEGVVCQEPEGEEQWQLLRG